MECEKCGAVVAEGAEVCPDCGAAVAVSGDGESPVDESAARERAPKGKLVPMLAIAAVVLVLVGGGVYLLWTAIAQGNSPEAATKGMLKAYAAYDADAMLNYVTHKTMPKDGVKELKEQVANLKDRAGGKPPVKDYTIVKVTMDGKEQATVEIEGEFLTEYSDKGKYETRKDKLTVVKQDGKWLVKMW